MDARFKVGRRDIKSKKTGYQKYEDGISKVRRRVVHHDYVMLL